MSGLGLLQLHCSNDRGLSKAAFVILQQPGVPLLNLKMSFSKCATARYMMQARLEGTDDSA